MQLLSAEREPHPAPRLVIGIGNPSRGDDAIGPLAVERLEALALPGVELLTDFQLQVEHALDLIGRRDLSHLKILFDAGKSRWPGVYWNAAARFPSEFAVGDTVDVVYRLERNTWGTSDNLRLSVVDLKK